MHFRELRRVRKESSGGLPRDVLEQLGLPMPPDVFEQFVCDHGHNDEFQSQYGDLDLHAVAWTLDEIPAAAFADCSVYPGFEDYLLDCETRATAWDHVSANNTVVEHWKDHGTWSRPPIYLVGSLAGSSKAIHLVEGHTRTGSLRGLVLAGLVKPDSLHHVWMGRATASTDDGCWREVVRENCIPFVDWLIEHQGNGGHLGKVARQLLAKRYDDRLNDEELEVFLDDLAHDSKHKAMGRAILAAHERWKLIVNE